MNKISVFYRGSLRGKIGSYTKSVHDFFTSESQLLSLLYSFAEDKNIQSIHATVDNCTWMWYKN